MENYKKEFFIKKRYKVLQINKTLMTTTKIFFQTKRKENKQFVYCFSRSNVEVDPYHCVHLENMETNFLTIYLRLLNFDP
jgi:hypothetical protein